MKELRTPYMIHLFALLHAGIVLLSHALHIRDELLLTAVTIALIYIIAARKHQNIGIIAASIITGNFLGFTIGTYGAQLLRIVITNDAWLHALTSLITTEILGFSFLFLFSFFNAHKQQNDTSPETHWAPNIRQIFLVIGGILLLRICYSLVFSEFMSDEGSSRAIRMLLGNSLAVVTLLCGNVIYIRTTRHFGWTNRPSGYITGLILESLLLASVTACIVGYDLPFGTTTPFREATFLQLLAITFLVNIGIYVLVFLSDYAWQARHNLYAERDKRHFAQFRYNLLKQQVNPHFLFNSLNILNGLVEEQKNAEASQYIRKLAKLYRYMLQNEKESVVRLSDELEFTAQYIDLLKVRFPNGFSVEMQIEPQTKNAYVVPCSIQLLIENALKHNAVRTENPLRITISTHEGHISVNNNIQPKYSDTEGTHLGLKNVAQQYRDIAGKEIVIRQTPDQFYVELPLI